MIIAINNNNDNIMMMIMEINHNTILLKDVYLVPGLNGKLGSLSKTQSLSKVTGWVVINLLLGGSWMPRIGLA
jgi:hypothetical protein